jgi:D-tyrosyl-tRNA(Tyr) deacylase
MRALVQRVTRARCTVGERETGAIAAGLVALVGVAAADGPGDADWLARKVVGLRIFADDAGLMNRDVREVGGGVLAVSQFTLYGDARRGRRPEFSAAARPEAALPLFERFCARVAEAGVPLATGAFREMMAIELVNDGPVTLMIESPGRAGAEPDAAPRGESP